MKCIHASAGNTSNSSINPAGMSGTKRTKQARKAAMASQKRQLNAYALRATVARAMRQNSSKAHRPPVSNRAARCLARHGRQRDAPEFQQGPQTARQQQRGQGVGAGSVSPGAHQVVQQHGIAGRNGQGGRTGGDDSFKQLPFGTMIH